MSAPILEVRGLHASIAGQQVVEDVTFEVPATGITAVLGRNGVGKTSTLRGILGLIRRTGEVRLAGERIDGAVSATSPRTARSSPG
jgi:branched-chain amino acid transport system ATP-binding protein